MSNLITVQLEVDLGVNAHDGKVMVSSRKIAEIFDKRHADVLRDIEVGIENLNKSDERNFALINFLTSSYKDERNRKQPEFLLTKDGFVYLTMGYSGKKATKFKVAYINRFNEMEDALKNLNIARLNIPN